MTLIINIHSKVNVWKTNNDLLLYTTIQKEIEANAILKNDNNANIANKVSEK